MIKIGFRRWVHGALTLHEMNVAIKKNVKMKRMEPPRCRLLPKTKEWGKSFDFSGKDIFTFLISIVWRDLRKTLLLIVIG